MKTVTLCLLFILEHRQWCDWATVQDMNAIWSGVILSADSFDSDNNHHYRIIFRRTLTSVILKQCNKQVTGVALIIPDLRLESVPHWCAGFLFRRCSLVSPTKLFLFVLTFHQSLQLLTSLSPLLLSTWLRWIYISFQVVLCQSDLDEVLSCVSVCVSPT